MYPILHLGPILIPAYGFIIVIGMILSLIIATFYCKIYNLPRQELVLATILASIGMIIGAKILYLVTVLPDVIKNFDYCKNDIGGTIAYLFGGYVFYGGLIGIIFGYWFYCKWFDLNFLEMMNIVAPVIPLAHSFGRIGCFFGGCCYGVEYHGRFAIQFPDNPFVYELTLVPRFPVQLFEAAINFILCIILLIFARKKRNPGTNLGIYLICYSILRFSVEFLRGDVERGILFGVSTSQWISLILIPIGIYLICKAKKISSER